MADEFNLADIFERIADFVPNNPALMCGDQQLSYAQLEERANKLANYWLSQGLGAGDHIGLLLYNSVEFVEAMIAALKIRAVPININYRYVAAELVYMFTNADLSAVIYQRGLCDRVSEALVDFDDLDVCMVLGSGDGGHAPGAIEYEEGLKQGSAKRDFPQRSGDDQVILYTGGTTGMPRGVMWRHHDLLFGMLQGGVPGGDPAGSIDDIIEGIDPDMTMNIVPAAPLIHGSSMFATWIAMFTGGCVALIGGRSYRAEELCRLVEKADVSVVALIGDAMARPLVDFLEANPDRYDMDSVSVVTSQGAILSGDIRARLTELLPYCSVMNNFGTSESGHQGEAFYDNDSAEAKPKWMMNERTCVVTTDLKRVTPGSGEMGRLATSGFIPQGYYKDPEKTAATFVTFEGKRWVIAGDMCTVDTEDIIHFHGRGSQCINTGGEKVFPEEVEEALKSHPAIFDALVVGVQDDKWGQRVEAVVALRSGFDFDESSVDAACRARVAGYKAPRGYHVVDAVPRHPSGKPQYSQARAIAMKETR